MSNETVSIEREEGGVARILQAVADLLAYTRHLGMFEEAERERLLACDKARYDRYVTKQNNKELPAMPYAAMGRPIFALEAAVAVCPHPLPPPSPGVLRTRPWSNEELPEELRV